MMMMSMSISTLRDSIDLNDRRADGVVATMSEGVVEGHIAE